MSESKTPQLPAGYPTQAPEPQYVKFPAVSREKSGSKGCMDGFIKGFTDALCCLLQSQDQEQGQGQDQGCCPCGNCCPIPCCWPCGGCPCKACCSPCGCCCWT